MHNKLTHKKKRKKEHVNETFDADRISKKFIKFYYIEDEVFFFNKSKFFFYFNVVTIVELLFYSITFAFCRLIHSIIVKTWHVIILTILK